VVGLILTLAWAMYNYWAFSDFVQRDLNGLKESLEK